MDGPSDKLPLTSIGVPNSESRTYQVTECRLHQFIIHTLKFGRIKQQSAAYIHWFHTLKFGRIKQQSAAYIHWFHTLLFRRTKPQTDDLPLR
ncbi:hypothetical protein DPMN_153138 [Dreissena polymorpha]|uniref:Uncharacterized protein n=1 Tax=Dreissena polymorpha TaxID=45954 RepID=A0A9D4FLR1_DREPO|nr:hypothetical protein DPMN_153138 [Dreissena polymorpha]